MKPISNSAVFWKAIPDGTDLRTTTLPQPQLPNSVRDPGKIRVGAADIFRPQKETANREKALRQKVLAEILECHALWVHTNGAEGERLSLRGANLIGADLSEADLWRASLRKANLVEADLREANLDRAAGWKASLNGVDLGEATLCMANLRGADLTGAKMETTLGVFVPKTPAAPRTGGQAPKLVGERAKDASGGSATDPEGYATHASQ